MRHQAAILTQSGFEHRPPAKEQVARDVQRLRQPPRRFVLISEVDTSTGGSVVTGSEDTLEEPWAMHVAPGSHRRLQEPNAVQQEQSLTELRRFWDTVGQHTQVWSLPNVLLSTYAQTGIWLESGKHAIEEEPPPIWDVAAKIAGQIAQEEWSKVPRDLARNVDHYLYRAPKEKDDA